MTILIIIIIVIIIIIIIIIIISFELLVKTDGDVLHAVTP